MNNSTENIRPVNTSETTFNISIEISKGFFVKKSIESYSPLFAFLKLLNNDDWLFRYLKTNIVIIPINIVDNQQNKYEIVIENGDFVSFKKLASQN